MKELNDGQHNFLDITLKVLGGLFVVISTIIAINQFKITKEREFLIILYQDDIQALNELFLSTSQIAIYPKNSEKFRHADSTFEELRAGKILFLNDAVLRKKVTKFFVAKEKYKSGSGAITKERLHQLSLDIAEYSRSNIEKAMRLK